MNEQKKRLNKPAQSGSGVRESLESRRAELLISKAFERWHEAMPVKVCSPHGDGQESIQTHLFSAESMLASLVRTGLSYELAVVITDKCNQSAINLLGGTHGAGDAAMNAHWDTLATVAAILAHANGCDAAELIRVNKSSDEGVLHMVGRNLHRSQELLFGKAWAHARRLVSLKNYAYTLEVPYEGKTRKYELDLAAFSRMLRHPDMVLSCHYSASHPSRITPNTEGMIAEEIRKLQNLEANFYHRLPDAFKISNDGLPEVISAFRHSLDALGIRQMGGGTLVELKLRPGRDDALALLPFISDGPGWAGTRKGFAEVYSAIGMRGFNTFLGKARANSILTPLAWAMKDISDSIDVYPLNGSYLQYWVNLPPDGHTRSLIADAVRKRIGTATEDPRYVNTTFEPVVTLVGAEGTPISEAKETFALASMGKGGLTADILNKVEFVINFVEHIHQRVQDDIYARLVGRGSSAIRESDLEHIGDIKHICSARRTIRTGEDIVWVLRNDESIPAGIKRKRQELETWLFEFSAAHAEKIFKLLADKINDQMKIRRP